MVLSVDWCGAVGVVPWGGSPVESSWASWFCWRTVCVVPEEGVVPGWVKRVVESASFSLGRCCLGGRCLGSRGLGGRRRGGRLLGCRVLVRRHLFVRRLSCCFECDRTVLSPLVLSLPPLTFRGCFPSSLSSGGSLSQLLFGSLMLP